MSKHLAGERPGRLRSRARLCRSALGSCPPRDPTRLGSCQPANLPAPGSCPERDPARGACPNEWRVLQRAFSRPVELAQRHSIKEPSDVVHIQARGIEGREP